MRAVAEGGIARVLTLTQRHLLPAPVILCAAPGYLSHHGVPTTPADLAHHACLTYGHLATDMQWTLMGPDGEHRVSIRGPLCSNNGEPLRDAAIHGLGITLLPRFLIEADLHSGRLVPVLPDYAAPLISGCVLYPVNRHLSTKVRLFTEFLRSRLSRDLA